MPARLVVMHTRTSKLPSGVLSLVSAEPSFNPKTHVTSVEVAGRTYEFRGLDKHDSGEWFRAIQKCVALR